MAVPFTFAAFKGLKNNNTGDHGCEIFPENQ
jgi:hypothetical protein